MITRGYKLKLVFLEDQESFEQFGHGNLPFDWHLTQGINCFWVLPSPKDSEISSSIKKLKGPPFLADPTPLHWEHAIILRSPHLLHMPKELQKIAKKKKQPLNSTNLIHPIYVFHEPLANLTMTKLKFVRVPCPKNKIRVICWNNEMEVSILFKFWQLSFIIFYWVAKIFA